MKITEQYLLCHLNKGMPQHEHIHCDECNAHCEFQCPDGFLCTECKFTYNSESCIEQQATAKLKEPVSMSVQQAINILENEKDS